MTAPLNHEDLQKLKGFVDFVSTNPTILNLPQLDFVKNFIEKFGGQVPAGEFKMPKTGGKCPFGGDAKPESAKPAAPQFDEEEEEASIEIESESDPESDVELDMEGVIKPDEVGDQPMGDPAKIPTEEEIDEASDLRAQAASAYSEQKFDEAITVYTKAIELNPGNALFYAKRGQAFLKLKKPNACIRDCDKALELNCDSAAAYKFRGRAHRLLGNWELAAKDLRQACKLDFDEETDEWLREVTPNAKKIEQHRIKQERRNAERKIKEREKAAHKARQARTKAESKSGAGAGASAGGAFPGGFPGAAGAGGFPFAGMPGGLNMGDMLSKMRDPEVAAAVQDILTNPNNIYKYASNPKISELLKGFLPNGFPGAEDANATGAAGENADGAKEDAGPDGDTAAPTAEKGDAKKKADFVDDGLD